MDSRMPLYDLVLLSSAGFGLLGIGIAQGTGIGIEQIQAVLVIVAGVAYMLLRNEVNRFIAAMAMVREIDTKQLRMARSLGLVWDAEAQDYVPRDSSGPHMLASGERTR